MLVVSRHCGFLGGFWLTRTSLLSQLLSADGESFLKTSFPLQSKKRRPAKAAVYSPSSSASPLHRARRKRCPPPETRHGRRRQRTYPYVTQPSSLAPHFSKRKNHARNRRTTVCRMFTLPLHPFSLQQNHFVRWFSLVAANYYSGRPLSYHAQQAQAAPPARPQPAVGEEASTPPALAPQPPKDAGEKANHTHVHGVPGACNTYPIQAFVLIQIYRLFCFFGFLFWTLAASA